MIEVNKDGSSVVIDNHIAHEDIPIVRRLKDYVLLGPQKQLYQFYMAKIDKKEFSR